MTKQEAIEILEEVKELDDTMHAYNPTYMNALDMAISALKEIHLCKDNKLCLVPEDVYSRQCSELNTYKAIGTVEECREAVEKLKRAEEALNVILSGNYNDECNFCVHNDNPMANCQCICGDGSWCIHNAKWNGKTSEDENLEGMEDV